MSILEKLKNIITASGIPVETGVFKDKPPDCYAVITPLSDRFALHAGNAPRIEVSDARVSLFCKDNYLQRVHTLTRKILAAGLLVTDRRYIGYETDSGFHHYCIDAQDYSAF